jgi:hypothetical protein
MPQTPPPPVAGTSGRPQQVLRCLARRLSLLIDHGKPLRVSLLVLAVAAVATVAVDQVAELFLTALWLDPSPARYLGLLASCAWAGLAVWYAARNAYRLRYPRWPALQNPRAAGLRAWLPRLLGAAVPLLVLLGYLLALRAVPHWPCEGAAACGRRGGRALGLLAETVVLVAFLVGRRPLWNRLCRGRAASLCASPREEACAVGVRGLGRIALGVYAASLGLNLLATVLIAAWPELLDGMGPLAILLAATGFLCLNGGFLCMLADRRGLPLLSLLLLVTALLHGLHLNDNHRVRQYPGMSTHQRPAAAAPETRPSFEAYANAWLDQRCRGRATCPVVLVAAEGGGVGGAAWTALVLGRLSEATIDADGRSRLARQLFAGSGVSGGSLGLATYVALLHQGLGGASLEARAQRLLGRDYLAPTLANMFFVDLTQRWLPGAWLDDRSRALTRAWEHAARQQGLDAFARPFADLYRQPDGSVDASLPALFLNSTTVAEGRRFIQHPFRPLDTPARQPWPAAFDGSAWLDPRVPLSEAVLDSARFTYVSPAGTLDSARQSPPLPSPLQLVDGGYFENSGATTLLDVMRLLRAVAARRGQALRFIVLHISSDPDLGDFVDRHDPTHPLPLYSAACPPAPAEPPPSPSGEATAPARALLDTRAARGEYARTELLHALHPDATDPAHGDVLWHFRICHGDYPVPLGWSISAPVFAELRRQLDANYPWRRMAAALDAQLAPPPPRATP